MTIYQLLEKSSDGSGTTCNKSYFVPIQAAATVSSNCSHPKPTNGGYLMS